MPDPRHDARAAYIGRRRRPFCLRRYQRRPLQESDMPMMNRAILAAILCGLWSVSCWAEMVDPAKQRLISEACAMIGQQRNSLSDGVAIAEANRKIEGEDAAKVKQRVSEWEAYFKAYVGADK